MSRLAPGKINATDILEVKGSNIPGAGMGLYAKVNIRAGTPVCTYFGDILDGRAAHEAAVSGDWARTAYLMRLAKNISVDAGPHLSCLARYINDHTDSEKINCRFVKDAARGEADVVSTRNISSGDEL